MNFNPVGTNERGEYFMKFHQPFSIVERIQLLQRWILVHSFCYYELNENVIDDFKYDANARQLEDLAITYPDEFKMSRYYKYFNDFFSDDGTHMTSGFDLLRRIESDDKNLYRHIAIDSYMTIDTKRMRGDIYQQNR